MGFRDRLAHTCAITDASAVTTFGQIPEVKAFLEHHKPVAFDHSGNDIWIDLQSGCVRFMDWDAYKEGPVEVAPSSGSL